MGSRNSFLFRWLKSNMLSNVPARSSAAPPPILPVPQLSSMKRRMDDWSVSVPSTKFDLAKEEITSSGRRGPKPHLPCTAPGALVPQLPGLFRLSAAVLDGVTIGDMTWSYHPSESSYEIMTAISSHSRLCCNRLMMPTMNCCSARGSEYPAWPSWKPGAFRKLTSGRLLAFTAVQKSAKSY